MGLVLDIDPQIQLNLVDTGICSGGLLAALEREGVAF
jgi:hypothetical protein